MAEEIVQYFVVNKELGMSAGKMAAQVAHSATLVTVDLLVKGAEHEPERFAWFAAWYNEQGMKKIVLKGSQKDLERLVEAGFLPIHDSGLTEIPLGSLTVVGLPPMPREIAASFTQGLSLY